MKNIFTGFLLVFLDFDLNLGSSKIGLLPDFIGYISMIIGLSELAQDSVRFTKAKTYAFGMAFYTGILYIFDFVGITPSFGVFSYLFSVLATVVSLYISYNIVMGVFDIEKKHGISLDGERLRAAWMLNAVFSVLTYLLYWAGPLGIFSVIAYFIVAVYFLVVFNRSKNLYYTSVR